MFLQEAVPQNNPTPGAVIAVQIFGDTGTPRLPDGRPAPRFLLSLMKYFGSPGITARSDKAMITIGKGLPDAELADLYALIRNAMLR